MRGGHALEQDERSGSLLLREDGAMAAQHAAAAAVADGSLPQACQWHSVRFLHVHCIVDGQQ